MSNDDPRPTDVTDGPGRDEHGGRYHGQTRKAIDAGLSPATIESVRQGCYSDAQLAELINTHRARTGQDDGAAVSAPGNVPVRGLGWNEQALIHVRLTFDSGVLPGIVLEKDVTHDQLVVLFDGIRDAVKAATALGSEKGVD